MLEAHCDLATSAWRFQRIARITPGREIGFQRCEQHASALSHCLHQVCRGALGPSFHTQERLRNLAFLNQRREGEPEFGAMKPLFLCPDVLAQKAAAQRSRKGEIGRVWFTDWAFE